LKSADELFEIGKKSFEQHIGEASLYPVEAGQMAEEEVSRLIDEYLWGTIYTRPNLDPPKAVPSAPSPP